MASPAPSTPPASLNIVALISGGKDSMFSLLHCLANGHKVIALANLYPAHQELDAFGVAQGSNLLRAPWDRDVDSFMYQTAGHNLIPLYSDALGLPLYRQEIIGDARDPSLSYSGHEDDETEALVPLLKKVKNDHPVVNAVSSGAILSTYQRTRIESVAIRLGLVPLAHLWQYPSLPPPSPGGLLEDMSNAGFDVRIVKVASGGLDETLLWSDLMNPLNRKKLERAVGRFGGSVLGEGGEYETMVIDGPSDIVAVWRTSDIIALNTSHPIDDMGFIIHFWRGRIKVAEADMHTMTEQGSDSSTFLTFREGGGQILPTDQKVTNSNCSTIVRPVLRIPGIWDKEFRELLQLPAHVLKGPPLFSEYVSRAATSKAEIAASGAAFLGSVSITDQMRPKSLERNMGNIGQSESEGLLTGPSLEVSKDCDGHDALTRIDLEKCTRTRQVGNICVIANLIDPRFGSTVQQQMRGVKDRLLAILKDIERPTSSIAFATIILRSMADFAAFNFIYGELFTRPNPPARVTIACALPADIKLMVSVVINMSDEVRALHVQSRSYWAPANIGPYSQAISMPLNDTLHPYLVFIAGQIPLVPGTMEMLRPSPTTPKEPSSTYFPWPNHFLQQCCLSLQHLWRIGREMKVNWWTGAVAFITGRGEASVKVATIWTIWREVHAPRLWKQDEKEDDEETDVWHTKYGGLASLNLGIDAEHILPDFDKVIHQSDDTLPFRSNNLARNFQLEGSEAHNVPGFFAVEVGELPRGSDIEWQSLGIAYCEVRIVTHSIIDEDCHLQVRSCIIYPTRTCVSYIEVPLPTKSEQKVTRGLSRGIDWARNVCDPASDLIITIYTPDMIQAMDTGAQVVPCHAVWGPGGQQLGAGMVTQFQIKDGMECWPLVQEQR